MSTSSTSIDLNIWTPDKFTGRVEQLVLESNCSYFDAILDICFKEGIEEETAAKLISTKLKRKVEAEVKKLNLVK